ncbi:MAG: hypothetical protein KGL53_15075 [Elusimicrobia bacterium]|nr:hypothetical protein [Elusimicrobiota bacterium]
MRSRSLALRSTLIGLAAVAPLAVLGGVSYRLTASALRTRAASVAESRAKLTAVLVEDALGERLRLVSGDAADPTLAAPVASRDAAAAHRRLDAQRAAGEFDRTFVVDRKGVLWADSPRAPESLNFRVSARDWFKEAEAAGRPVVSAVFVRHARPQVPVVIISAPVLSGGRRVGTLAQQYRLQSLASHFGSRAFGRSGRIVVYDDAGLPVDPGAAAEARRPALSPPVRGALAGLSGIIDYVDPATRVPMTAAFAPIRAGARRWAAVAEEPRAETEGALRTLRLQLGLTTLAAALVAAWAALLLSGARERERSLVADFRERDRRLEEQTRELARSNSDLEQFAYLASHDLQAPLRSLKNYCDLFTERCGADLNDEGRRLVSLTRASVERMQRMVSDLLEFSRLSRSGEAARPVPLERCLDEALADLAAELGRRRAAVERGALPVVEGRAGELTRLLQNLVSNALKYCEADPRVRVHAERHNGHWQVSVEDNGIGIPPDKREAVFGLFERLHPWERYHGSGIGLAACRKIVERHGGRIWVDESPDGGTAMRFTLPASLEPGPGLDNGTSVQ